ncbi:MAG: Serine/threonine-protein kinase PknD [Chlamydiia bacterium]|nr:Serine/threonine-protein kinase PknD [Chlamydiia bacterium]
MDQKHQKSLNILLVKLLLQTENIQELDEIFSTFEEEELNNTRSLIYFFKVCLLWKKQGKKAAQELFEKVPLDTFPHPHILATHTILETLPTHIETKALFWEKYQMYKKLALFYAAIGKDKKAKEYKKMLLRIEQDSHTAG